MFSLLFTELAHGAALNGEFFLLRTNGTLPVSPSPITGDAVFSLNQLTIDDFLLYNRNTTVTVMQILNPGDHTVTTSSGDLTVTVAPGQVGAQMEVQGFFTPYVIVNVWSINQNGNLVEYTSIDVDGDGIVGMKLISGQFNSFNMVFDFTTDAPAGNVTIAITPSGGATHECTAIGGDIVTVNSDVLVVDGGVLDTVFWKVDGIDVATGDTLTEFITLGSHTISATALLTSGVTTSDTFTLTVEDTQAPIPSIIFVDELGNPVTSKSDGYVDIQLSATDICDDTPGISNGSAVPVMNVVNGDRITIINQNNQVIIPTQAVAVSVTASDASGNQSTITEQLFTN